MNRNWTEALVRQGSSVWRWAGATFAAVAMSVGVAPAFAADVYTLDLQTVQSPKPAVYGTPATYTVTLTNTSNKTVNNASITVVAPAGTGSFDAVWPSCTLSTGLPCAAPVRSDGTSTFKAGGYQLPAKGWLRIVVGYYMPGADKPFPDSFTLTVTGTSSNNAGGPNPSAFTTLTTNPVMAPMAPPPSYPSIELGIGQDTPVLWSTAPCANLPTDDRDCGATYYGQYTVTVKNKDSVNAIPASKPFDVEVSSPSGPVKDSFGCEAPCFPTSSNSKFTIKGLSADGSTAFKVVFQSPTNPLPLDVKAVATVGPSFTPPLAALSPAPSASAPTIFSADAPIENYSSLVPSSGGSARARNLLDVPNNVGPYSTRVDIPGYPKGAVPANIAIDVAQGLTSCSSWSPKCLETQLDIQISGTPVEFGAPNTPLDGSQLVITMVREASTLNKKPSSVFNATVWYTDTITGNRDLIKNCGSVDLWTAERCVAQRIDMTSTAADGTRTGYVKFIIWARHNGKIGW